MCMLLGWRGGAGISSTKANKQILLLIHLRIPSGAPFFFVNTHSPIPFDSLPLHSFFMFLFFNERFLGFWSKKKVQMF